MKLVQCYNEKYCYDINSGREEFFKQYRDYQTYSGSRWKGPNGIRYYMNIDLLTERINYDDYFAVGIFQKITDYHLCRKVCSTYWRYKPTKEELWKYARENTMEKSRPVFNTETIWIRGEIDLETY